MCLVKGHVQTEASGIILCMGPANERWRYNLTSSLIGWMHIQNDPWGIQLWSNDPILGFHEFIIWYWGNWPLTLDQWPQGRNVYFTYYWYGYVWIPLIPNDPEEFYSNSYETLNENSYKIPCTYLSVNVIFIRYFCSNDILRMSQRQWCFVICTFF